MKRSVAAPIGLLSAVAFEADEVLSVFGIDPKSIEQGQPVKCKFGELSIVYSTTGIGIVNTAISATRLIERHLPSLIIQIGIGGAFPMSGLSIGDIAVATHEVYSELGVILDDGFHTINSIGLPIIRAGRQKLYNEFPLDKSLARIALSSAKSVGLHAKAGKFLSVSTVTGTLDRARELEGRFSVICENMEGVALAHVGLCYGIPVVELRGVSNIVEDRDISKWDKKTASFNVQKAALELLRILAQ